MIFSAFISINMLPLLSGAAGFRFGSDLAVEFEPEAIAENLSPNFMAN